MKNILGRFLRLHLTAFLLCLGAGLGAPAANGAEDDVRITGTHDRQSFSAGARVTIDATASDDLYAVGGDILVDDADLRDISLAGGWITFTRSRAEDLQAVGGNISVRGRVDDDVMAAGFRVALGERAVVGGDLMAAGAFVTLAGRVDGNVKVTAGRLAIEGEIRGDVEIMAESIRISPDAVILGAITYRSPEAADLAPGARIDGPVERRMTDDLGAPLGFFGVLGAIILAALGGLLALILLSAAAQRLVPRLLDAATATLGARSFSSLALGFAVLVSVPVGSVLLFTTLVGAPLGVVAMALYVVGLAFGLVVAGYWAGQRLRAIAHRTGPPPGFWNRLLWTAVGLALLLLLAVIPYLGGILAVLALAGGLGAFVLQAWPRAVERS